MTIFDSTTLNLVAIYQQSFCLCLALIVLFNLSKHKELIDSDVLFLYGSAKKVFNRIKIPQLTPRYFYFSGVILIISLLFAGIGIYTRFFLALALCFYFIYFSQLIVYEDVGRKTHMMPFMLGIFLIAPGLEQPWISENVYWPLWMAKLVIVQMYVSAAIQKFKNTGFKWSDGNLLRDYLIAHDLWHGMPVARIVAQKLWLCRLLSTGVMLFQLSIWVILIWPELTIFYALVAISFHLSTSMIMRIHYLKYLSCSYIVLFIEPVAPLIIEISKHISG